MRGNDDRHHHGMHIAVGDNLGDFLIHADGVVHPSGAVWLLTHLFDDLPGVLPEPAYVMGHRDLFFVAGFAPSIDRMRDRKGAQGGDFILGDAKEMQGDQQRHLVQHSVNQIDTA